MNTILVVDDDAMTLRMLEYHLGSAGHQVVTTTEPVAAADLAMRHQVDAVILDVLMPGRSGYEVLAELHERPETKNIPVLMLSSLSQSSHRVKGLREGADEYVGKPFDPEELLLRLNRLLNIQRGEEAEFSGSLSTISIGEVTQSLLHASTEGVLEVMQGNRRGYVILENGRATEATFGRLHGQQAVLAMLELKTGTFRFVRRPRDLSATDHGIDLAMEQAMFTSAWLHDELGRWPDLGGGTLLWVTGATESTPSPPPGYQRLPVLTLWQEIVRHPGVSAREIIDRDLAAPQVASLTLRMLFHTGVLSSDPPAEGAAQGSPMIDREVLAVRAAVAATVQAARSLGFGGDLIHILLVADQTAKADVLELHRQLPKEALAAPSDSLTCAWEAGRTASLPLAAPSGQMILHLATTDSDETLEHLKRRTSDYSGIILWLSNPFPIDDVDSFLNLVDDDRWGLVLAGEGPISDSVNQLVEDRPRWSHARVLQPTLAEVLRLLAASAGQIEGPVAE